MDIRFGNICTECQTVFWRSCYDYLQNVNNLPPRLVCCSCWFAWDARLLHAKIDMCCRQRNILTSLPMQPQIMEIIVGFTCGTPAVAKLIMRMAALEMILRSPPGQPTLLHDHHLFVTASVDPRAIEVRITVLQYIISFLFNVSVGSISNKARSV